MVRKYWFAAGLLLVLGLGTAWAAPAIKLGAHAPQSGSLAKHGIEQVKGIRLAAEEFEKKTKIKVDLLVYDDESNPQKAVSAVEKLAGVDKVKAIVGRLRIQSGRTGLGGRRTVRHPLFNHRGGGYQTDGQEIQKFLPPEQYARLCPGPSRGHQGPFCGQKSGSALQQPVGHHGDCRGG